MSKAKLQPVVAPSEFFKIRDSLYIINRDIYSSIS